jgi:hypothetical protein
VRKIIALLSFFVLACNLLFAQDDDLPPPSSKPENTEQRSPEKPPAANDFKGFGKPKKVDLSKFIIEPIVNLSISQYQAEIGFSPSIGYRVFQPKNVNPRLGSNTGLFIGAGITYRYNHFNEGNGLKYNMQVYGGGPLVQYNIWRGLFARVKLELLGRRYPSSVQLVGSAGNLSYKVNYKQLFVPACLLGAGYNLLASKNIFVPIVVSYDLFHSIVSKDISIYPRGFTVQLGFITLF